MQQPFYAALAQLSDFYGITMQDDDFENIALHAWDHIGNKDVKLYEYHTEVLHGQIELPCNADIIEGIFKYKPKCKSIDDIKNWHDSDYFIENSVKKTLGMNTPFLNYSDSIGYEREGNTLKIPKLEGHTVYVLYKGVLLDENGLPFLNFKEVDAIAKYCAFIHLQKKAFITKDQATFQMAQMMRQQWQSSVEDARVAPYINQNEFDQILNVSSSWDRKRFGVSLKLFK